MALQMKSGDCQPIRREQNVCVWVTALFVFGVWHLATSKHLPLAFKIYFFLHSSRIFGSPSMGQNPRTDRRAATIAGPSRVPLGESLAESRDGLPQPQDHRLPARQPLANGQKRMTEVGEGGMSVSFPNQPFTLCCCWRSGEANKSLHEVVGRIVIFLL